MLGLWGFEGGAGGIEGRWIRLSGTIRMTAAVRGSIFDDFTVALAGLNGPPGRKSDAQGFAGSRLLIL